MNKKDLTLRRLEVINQSTYFEELFKKEFPNISLGVVWDGVKNDLVKEEVIKKLDNLVPICFRIEEKVFLLGGEYSSYIDGLPQKSFELFDMTTEMKNGDICSFYTTSLDYFRFAHSIDVRQVYEYLNTVAK